MNYFTHFSFHIIDSLQLKDALDLGSFWSWHNFDQLTIVTCNLFLVPNEEFIHSAFYTIIRGLSIRQFFVATFN